MQSHLYSVVLSSPTFCPGRAHSAWLCTEWASGLARSPWLHLTWTQSLLGLLPPTQLQPNWGSVWAQLIVVIKLQKVALRQRAACPSCSDCTFGKEKISDRLAGRASILDLFASAHLKRWQGRRLSGNWALRWLPARQAGGWRPFWNNSPLCRRCWKPPAAAVLVWTSLSANPKRWRRSSTQLIVWTLHRMFYGKAALCLCYS